MSRTIHYFDYNATSPVREEVAEAMMRAQRVLVGNPSSMHSAGRRARALIDEARSKVAGLLGTEPRHVVFTSGATEANNAALRGWVARGGTTIVTSVIEHASILATAAALERSGSSVVRLPVDGNGDVKPGEIARHCAAGPCLVALGWANGESGHIRDVRELVAEVGSGSRLLIDAAQCTGRVPTSVLDGIDLLSFSGHKFGGPHGIGALVMTSDCIEPMLTGGPQERSMRAGTENLAAIVGLGVAAECAEREIAEEACRLTGLRERLWSSLSDQIPGLLRISPTDGLPGTLTVAPPGLGADVVVAGLDLSGFCVSTGSACAAAAPEPSHVMRGLGLDPQYLNGVVRISMGRSNDTEDVDALARAFVEVVRRARHAA